MKNIFYVWYATAEENEKGEHRKSQPFTSLRKAQDWALKLLESNKEFVSIDKVREYIDENGNECEKFIAMYSPHKDGWVKTNS